MHVTHVRHALSILDARTIASRPVYDESRLNTTRIHVVWLSPNTWDGAEGSRYGGVSFGFEWRGLIDGTTARPQSRADFVAVSALGHDCLPLTPARERVRGSAARGSLSSPASSGGATTTGKSAATRGPTGPRPWPRISTMALY
jgi:hypothetical protein